MDKHKLILPISILLGCIILGGFFYASQVNKQKSIEKQQQIEIQAKAGADKAQQDKIKQDEEAKRLGLSLCLRKADDDYFSYLELNGIKNKDGSIRTTTEISDIADRRRQNAIDNCYKQYK